MSGTYLTWLADELRAAGLTVVEYDGWQTRARSSGGYAEPPLCVMWHHTASSTTPRNDADYMCHGSDSRPIANLLIARDGAVWVLAAGATNTNGKGHALTFSRGTVPADSMNTRALGCEIANSGVGEVFPQAQIDTMFAVSNACNARFGNVSTDICTHQQYAPDRKIDPATASAVAGPWQPSSCSGSGTWSLSDIREECVRRTTTTPAPDGDDDMYTTATVWTGRQLHVFERGADGALWHDWTDGEGTWDRETLGGAITSSPSASARLDGSNGLDITARGTDDALHHIWFDGTAWSNWERVAAWP